MALWEAMIWMVLRGICLCSVQVAHSVCSLFCWGQAPPAKIIAEASPQQDPIRIPTPGTDVVSPWGPFGWHSTCRDLSCLLFKFFCSQGLPPPPTPSTFSPSTLQSYSPCLWTPSLALLSHGSPLLCALGRSVLWGLILLRAHLRTPFPGVDLLAEHSHVCQLSSQAWGLGGNSVICGATSQWMRWFIVLEVSPKTPVGFHCWCCSWF